MEDQKPLSCTPGLCHLVRDEQNEIRNKIKDIYAVLDKLDKSISDLKETMLHMRLMSEK
jgi:hypothetical protein